ncbi:MAG: DNA polymerase III subunit alpha [Chlamydiales bacterium]|nr:DNA polymerase III subunit alpha [Chlamydiales bacterium]
MTWVPLHCHSQYSILDSTASISQLVEKAKQDNMPGLALTDNGNLFGAVEFYKACVSASIKPIIGSELYLTLGSRFDRKKVYGQKNASAVVLLAKNSVGYKNLCKLSSIGYLEGFYYVPRIDKEVLEQYSEGLICLSGSTFDSLSSFTEEESCEALEKEVSWYHSIFKDDYYLELQRHKMSQADIHNDEVDQESWLFHKYQDYTQKQELTNDKFCKVAQKLGVKLVATNDSRYLERDEWKAHEILLNVQCGETCEIWEKDHQGRPKYRVKNPKRRTYASHELYFKSQQQIGELFKDIPDSVSNTLEVLEKCQLELDFKTKHYPVFYPPGIEKEQVGAEELREQTGDYLKKLCYEGIPLRYPEDKLAKVKEKFPDKDPIEIVNARLEGELDIIISKGLADYLLIVWDFIHWAKGEGIPVGPGRGSGAGSIVLYLIGVTDIEPLRFDLFFERFINPERLSYPDIDVDICMSQRSKVIDYTLGKYGKECVAQIITFGTMKAKMAIKDVGRVLNIPLSKVNQLAKLIPDDLNMTIEKALEIDHDLKEMCQSDDESKRVIDLGRKVEGSIRNTGIHAAGVIISGEGLMNLIPVCRAKDAEMTVTQYSMKPVEAVGMLKVDFLGLKTLTSIQVAVNSVSENHKVNLDWMNLPLEDSNTFDLLNQGKTLGVFQLESSGMQDLARQLHLDRFEEIIAVLALYRPGPMDMIPSFIERKHGREEIQYDHPMVERILSETYGIMVYQEQVMQIAQELANFSLGEGDVLRRAMGKKDMQQMATQREKFRLGAKENGIEDELSMAIFDKMEKFAAYGFNKSHAAAYGYLTYVTAYLKANYPSEWMAALMTCDRDDLSKVAKFIRECKSMGIEILPPDVNEAGNQFVATSEGIRFAMSGVKGVGSGVVDAIIAERQQNGPFESLYNFVQRLDHKKVGKKVVENLIMAGAFNFTSWPKTAMVQQLDSMFQEAQKKKQEKAQGVISLFSLMEEQEESFVKPPFKEETMDATDLLFKEKELLGFFLTGHPMENYSDLLKKLSCVSLSAFEDLPNNSIVRTAFIIEECKVRVSVKSGRKFAILRVSDGLENKELPIWSELFEAKQAVLNENGLMYSVIKQEEKDGDKRYTCCWLDDLTSINEQMILECDQAYDKAKFQVERLAKLANKADTTKGNKKEKKESAVKKSNYQAQNKVAKTKILNLSLDIDTVRLSEVIKVKEILRKYPGPSEVQLEFAKGKQAVGVITAGEGLSVELGDNLKKDLNAISSLLSLKFDEK